MKPELWALAGVVLGFALAELSQSFRRQLAVRRAKRNLQAELQTLLGVIPQKRHIIAQARSALSHQGIMPTSGVPASRIGYDVFFPTALPSLDRVSRACIHNVYERMIWGDRYLDSFKDQILTAIQEKITDDPYAEFDGRLEELDGAYLVAQNLIQGYLRGEPQDVYPETEVSNLDPPAA